MIEYNNKFRATFQGAALRRGPHGLPGGLYHVTRKSEKKVPGGCEEAGAWSTKYE
jgi:hypothetical protein